MLTGKQRVEFTLGIDGNGNVIVDFGAERPVDHISMTPQQAIAMAEGLLEAVGLAQIGYDGKLRHGR